MPLKIKQTLKWLLLTSLVMISSNTLLSAETQTLPSKAAFSPIIDDLTQRFPRYSSENVILIVAKEQSLYLLHKGTPIEKHTISTSEFGIGSQSGSNKTPAGVHIITQKYGTKAKLGTIFKARANTGRVAKILTKKGQRSNADNVTSRILWLSGLEKGINKGDNVDSHRRYIYIHGTDEEGRLGSPASHGCIRMNNQAVIDLYKKIPIGTLVVILP